MVIRYFIKTNINTYKYIYIMEKLNNLISNLYNNIENISNNQKLIYNNNLISSYNDLDDIYVIFLIDNKDIRKNMSYFEINKI